MTNPCYIWGVETPLPVGIPWAGSYRCASCNGKQEKQRLLGIDLPPSHHVSLEIRPRELLIWNTSPPDVPSVVGDTTGDPAVITTHASAEAAVQKAEAEAAAAARGRLLARVQLLQRLNVATAAACAFADGGSSRSVEASGSRASIVLVAFLDGKQQILCLRIHFRVGCFTAAATRERHGLQLDEDAPVTGVYTACLCWCLDDGGAAVAGRTSAFPRIKRRRGLNSEATSVSDENTHTSPGKLQLSILDAEPAEVLRRDAARFTPAAGACKGRNQRQQRTLAFPMTPQCGMLTRKPQNLL
ncbi:hypothetical protein cyc_09125 [Cyclospora cayetanensis]|uniref:Uncharacterized protein n=1 Tax=Cyclospora cayetanensis TaxID=88456 RepID=A0A1D3D5N2_9EIME|nr:hypothetical protein cyc_09125 [Cyclospora cayetanensis]